jgi:FkbM family methyltransferase
MFKNLFEKLIIKYFELVPFLKGKDKLFRFAKKRSMLGKPFNFRFRPNTRMYIDVSDFIQVNIFFHKCYYYEKFETFLWLELTEKANIIFDIGANVGYYSLLAAGNKKAGIYSFEPITATFEKLEKNKDLNRFRNINCFKKVVSNKPGTIKMFLGDELNRGMSSIVKSETMSNEFEEAEAIVLDEFCSSHSIGKVDLVKIDVEGSEMLVLGGMNKILENSKPFLMIEVLNETLGKFGFSIVDIYRFLDQKGYRPYRITGNKEVQKIHEPEEQMGLVLFVHKEIKLPASIKIND